MALIWEPVRKRRVVTAVGRGDRSGALARGGASSLLVTPGELATGRSRRSLRRFWIARRVLSQGSYKAEQSLMFGTAGPRAQERTDLDLRALAT
jgi:hypothetical protein